MSDRPTHEMKTVSVDRKLVVGLVDAIERLEFLVESVGEQEGVDQQTYAYVLLELQSERLQKLAVELREEALR